MSRPARLHACGTLGRLTVAQIAHLSGLCESTVRRRVLDGVRGEALAQAARPTGFRSVSYRDRNSRTGSSIEVACRIARKFRGETPTVAQLRKELGMSHTTAVRWRNAWIEGAR